MNRLLRPIAKYLLPVLFISYVGCISLFSHTHVVNGVTIVHSHPYKPGAEHGHTTAEFQLIHTLSHVTMGEPSIGLQLSVVLFAFFCRLLYPLGRYSRVSALWRAHGLRAPPVSIL